MESCQLQTASICQSHLSRTWLVPGPRQTSLQVKPTLAKSREGGEVVPDGEKPILSEPNDPHWAHVSKVAENFPLIPAIEYMGRLNDVVLLFRNLLAIYVAHGRPSLEYQISTGLEQTIPEFIDRAFIGAKENEGKVKRELSEMIAEFNKTKLAEFERRIPNHSLVSLCTVFDSYLNKVVDAIVQSKKEILFGSKVANRITLKKVVEAGTIESLVENYRAAEVLTFSHKSIEQKLGYFSDLGIDIEKLFDGSLFDPKVNPRISNWKRDQLIDIYNKRNDIVHQDSIVVADMEEIDDIFNFFTRLCLLISVVVPQKFPGVMSDLTVNVAKGAVYRKLKGESDPSIIPGENGGTVNG
jgi:hypothetical protein